METIFIDYIKYAALIILSCHFVLLKLLSFFLIFFFIIHTL